MRAGRREVAAAGQAQQGLASVVSDVYTVLSQLSTESLHKNFS